MQRVLVYFSFAGLLFVLGLTAGRSITDRPAIASTSAVVSQLQSPQASCSKAQPCNDDEHLSEELTSTLGLRMTASLPTLADQLADNQQDAASLPASFASHETTPNSAIDSVDTPTTNQPLPVSPEVTASSDALVQLIRRMIPTADDATVAVWAESYRGMDLSEVEFILEQKRLHEPSLLTGTSLSSDVMPLESKSSNAQGTTSLVQAIESNLREVQTVGYRRITVLTEPLAGSFDAASQRDDLSREFRCFDKGRIISSPVSTHVAIASDSRDEMFLLENNRLTRRGDFRRLSDETFGLSVAGQEFRIDGSPTNIDSATRLRISESGEILASGSGSESALGRLTVVKVTDLSTLTTADGVIFECHPVPVGSSSDAPDQSAVFEKVANVRVVTGSLELSNVNVTEELQLRSIFTITNN